MSAVRCAVEMRRGVVAVVVPPTAVPGASAKPGGDDAAGDAGPGYGGLWLWE